MTNTLKRYTDAGNEAAAISERLSELRRELLTMGRGTDAERLSYMAHGLDILAEDLRDETIHVSLDASRFPAEFVPAIVAELARRIPYRTWKVTLDGFYACPVRWSSTVRAVALEVTGMTADGSPDEPWNRDVDADA